ncbi:DUF4192 domain-containing protein [Saccharopolyspora sp. MS10]|uniref:DUF4192 domain-containing protein n=1 Tax=Saccharopolyspora sp. MS10 TaxID=3385973 RepID=UPI0039A2DEC9
MTTPLNARIHIGDAGQVLAAVPHLLGFTPSDSLVLLGLHATGDAGAFGLTLRMDLPPPEHRRALTEYLSTGPPVRRGITGAIVVLVGTGPGDPRPQEEDAAEEGQLPQPELVAMLREGFAEAGIDVLHELWAPRIEAGARWRCYDDPACRGRIPDPKRTVLGAAMAASGSVTFDSREELQRLVAPESERIRARWAARLAAMIEDGEQARREGGGVHRDVEVALAGIRRTAAGEALTEDDQLRILLALSDHRVRDLCLGLAAGEWARPAEQLWLSLVRKAPEPEVAEVAALLAFSAYLRGEGAMASVALERVESSRPEHVLGCLLRRALDSGISPTEIAEIAKDTMTDARLMIEAEES